VRRNLGADLDRVCEYVCVGMQLEALDERRDTEPISELASSPESTFANGQRMVLRDL
jgi:hypothetical protein